MIPSQSVYDSARLAALYAYDRPQVHRQVIQAVGELLHFTHPVPRALDIGCGAGLSTAGLNALAKTVVGLEPIRAMLAHRNAVAPNALFLVGQAERLPFVSESFDLMTAAGSLDYVHLNLFLPEAARVLTADGVLIIYDFSPGRRLRGSTLLEEWYDAFERRYPPSPCHAFDVKRLAYSGSGLRLDAYRELEVSVPMNLRSYLSYALSETGVESAIAQGTPEEEVRGWCQSTLSKVLGDEFVDVIFEPYVACIRRAGKA